jgi:hypothetical protein
VEKWIRVALGPLTLEGIPRGRYRLLEKSEVEALCKLASPAPRKGQDPGSRSDAGAPTQKRTPPFARSAKGEPPAGCWRNRRSRRCANRRARRRIRGRTQVQKVNPRKEGPTLCKKRKGWATRGGRDGASANGSGNERRVGSALQGAHPRAEYGDRCLGRRPSALARRNGHPN